jgi:Fe-S-cluster containining protein
MDDPKELSPKAEEKRDDEALIMPEEVAIKLLQATSMPDDSMFPDRAVPMNTVIDYYRIACHVLFICERCGTCCTTGDPIRLRQDDLSRIAKHLKIPPGKAIKKLTVPDPDRPSVLNFKKILPCKFYDPVQRECKIYYARPWSCRIFPFIGIYGSEDHVKVHESCPSSVKVVKMLTEALEEVRSDPTFLSSFDLDTIRRAKQWFKDVLKSVK